MTSGSNAPFILDSSILAELTQRFTDAGVEALALTGSHARGEASRFSDIDLLRFVVETPTAPCEVYRLKLMGERLVSVTTTSIATKRAEFTQPKTLIFAVPGLRQARILADAHGGLAALIAEAQAFTWTPALRDAAGAFTSNQLAGLAEEALKLLGALEREHVSAMLYATLGLELGLTRAALVARGTLLATENDYFDAAMAAGTARWQELLRIVAGYSAPLAGASFPRTRGEAALLLYVEAARMFADSLMEDDRTVVAATVAHIQRALTSA